MSNWNLSELRNLVENCHGESNLIKAKQYINSIDGKIRCFAYHYLTAKDAFKEVFSGIDCVPQYAFNMCFDKDEAGNKFRMSRLVYEANVIAAGQALHSILDIMSHVILHSLNLSGLDETRLNLKIIQKELDDCELKKKIVRVNGLRQVDYLNAFVNTTKHYRVIDTVYNFDLTGEAEQEHGMLFNEFEYKSSSYTKKTGDKVLSEFCDISDEYIELGQCINQYLSDNQC